MTTHKTAPIPASSNGSGAGAVYLFTSVTDGVDASDTSTCMSVIFPKRLIFITASSALA